MSTPVECGKKKNMTDIELIEKLGGTTKVAEALGFDPRVVSNWKKRGISGVGRYLIADLANSAGVRLPKTFKSKRSK